MKKPLILILFSSILLWGCPDTTSHSRGVYMLLDTSGTYKKELEQVLQAKGGEEIEIYQSAKDELISGDLYQAKFDVGKALYGLITAGFVHRAGRSEAGENPVGGS